MTGRVITFYSYKGGVGRTFALANIGVILAQWGYRVLVVDWDIEAPGLNYYFSEYVQPTSGVLTYLVDCRSGRPKGWQAYTSEIHAPGWEQSIHLMAAANVQEDYTSLVQSLDWDELYNEHALGTRLEELRSQWIENFDFVLIDSRTGVTDFSGLTTAQLPDILAFLFTANVQSLEGCCQIAERAMAARRNLPVDRPALIPLPLVAKFDQREEYDRAQAWRLRFNERLATFLDVWAPRETSKPRLIDLMTIPYVPRWTFGEDLAAVIEPHDPNGVRSASTPLSYTLETIAAVLANGFRKIELLSSSRDEYVLTARAALQTRKTEGRARKRVFISYTSRDAPIAHQVQSAISTSGWDSTSWDTTDAAALPPQTLINQAIEQSDAMIVIVGQRASTYQDVEVEAFLRNTLRSSKRAPIIPLVLPEGKDVLMKSRLADFSAIWLDPNQPIDAQMGPIIARLNPPVA